MGVKISLDKINNVMNPQTKRMLNSSDRPNKGTKEDILSFKGYFSEYTLINGVHGPEEDEKNGQIYLSIYHFLEYEGEDPKNYDTFNTGADLSKITKDYKVCKYEEQDHDINKYEYNFLKENQRDFRRIKK